jgi:hypothetical protein
MRVPELQSNDVGRRNHSVQSKWTGQDRTRQDRRAAHTVITTTEFVKIRYYNAFGKSLCT